MTELFVSVFSASALIGIASQLTHTRYRGRVSTFALGVIFLFVIVSQIAAIDAPSLDISAPFPDGGDEGEYYYAVRDAVRDAVGDEVAREFGFSSDEVSVELINFDFDKMSCDTVVVTLSGAAALGDYKRVEAHVDKIGIGRCRVDVQIG